MELKKLTTISQPNNKFRAVYNMLQPPKKYVNAFHPYFYVFIALPSESIICQYIRNKVWKQLDWRKHIAPFSQFCIWMALHIYRVVEG